MSLDAAAIDDLVTDIVAGLGAPMVGGRRHPRFLRPVLVRRLLTRTGDLLEAGTMPGLPTANGSDLVLRITEIAQIVGTPDHIDHAFQVVANTPGDQRPSETTVGSAVERGEIKLIPGHRLGHGDLRSGGSVPVLGVEEIVGTFATGQRRVDRLEFASRYPRVVQRNRATWSSAPHPGRGPSSTTAADRSSLYPARVARIMESLPPASPHGCWLPTSTPCLRQRNRGGAGPFAGYSQIKRQRWIAS